MKIGNFLFFRHLDILIAKYDSKTEEASLVSYYNNYHTDAFTLKATLTNGQKSEKYSSAYYGGMFKIKVTELDTSTHDISGVQCSQSSFLSFELPYVYFGLGRTNNYIENFYAAVPIPIKMKNIQDKDLNHYHQWTPIIPNSQLFVFPSVQKNSDWKLKLFIDPSEFIWYIILATIVMLLILGAMIIWRYWKEKEEDKKEKSISQVGF